LYFHLYLIYLAMMNYISLIKVAWKVQNM